MARNYVRGSNRLEGAAAGSVNARRSQSVTPRNFCETARGQTNAKDKLITEKDGLLSQREPHTHDAERQSSPRRETDVILKDVEDSVYRKQPGSVSSHPPGVMRNVPDERGTLSFAVVLPSICVDQKLLK